jgi:hypothetical protein
MFSCNLPTDFSLDKQFLLDKVNESTNEELAVYKFLLNNLKDWEEFALEDLPCIVPLESTKDSKSKTTDGGNGATVDSATIDSVDIVNRGYIADSGSIDPVILNITSSRLVKSQNDNEFLKTEEFDSKNVKFISYANYLITATSNKVMIHKNEIIEINSEYGEITSIDALNTQVVVGYSSGYVSLYDINTMKQRIISNQTRISHVQIPKKNIFFSADDKGFCYYYEYDVKLLQSTLHSTRIHGSINSFVKILDFKACRLNQNILLAITTPYKISVISINPKPHIVFRILWQDLMEIPIQAKYSSLAWYGNTLAYTINSTIGIFQLFQNRFHCTKIKKYDHNVLFIGWINQKFLFCQFPNYFMILNDLERIEYSDWDKISSVFIHNEIIWIKSNDILYKKSLFSLDERIQKYNQMGEYEKAIDYCVSLYWNKVPFAFTYKSQDISILDFILLQISILLKKDKVDLIFDTLVKIKADSGTLKAVYMEFCNCDLQTLFLKKMAIKLINHEFPDFNEIEIARDLINHPFENSQDLILAIDLKNSVDLDYVLIKCREKGYLSALIHIYNFYLDEYLLPLQELIYYLMNCTDPKSEKSVLFNYLNDINIEKLPSILSFVFSKEIVEWKVVGKSLMFQERPWPCIKYFYSIDPLQMNTFIYNLSQVMKNKWDHIQNTITQQSLLDMLFELIQETSHLSEDLIYALIARLIGEFTDDLLVSDTHLNQVSQYLIDSTNMETVNERQQGILALYQSKKFVEPNDTEFFLEKLKSNGLFKVYEYKLISKSDFKNAINIYINRRADPTIFESIQNWISSNKDSSEIILNLLKENAQKLIYKGSLLSTLVDKNWPLEHSNFLALFGNDELEYFYLDTLLRDNQVQDLELIHQYLKLVKGHGSELLLEKLQKYNIVDDFVYDLLKDLKQPKVWVLVKLGQYREAIDLNIELLTTSDKEVELETILDQCMELTTYTQDYLHLYFTVIDKISKDMRSKLIDFLFNHLPADSICNSILHKGGQDLLSKHKTAILALIQNYQKQINSLNLTLKISNEYDFTLMKEYVTKSKKSFVPFKRCMICNEYFHLKALTLEQQKGELIVFGCNHGYHLDCIQQQISAKSLGIATSSDLWCIMCSDPIGTKGKQKVVTQTTVVIPY